MQVANRCMRKKFRVLTVREMQVRTLQHLTPVRMAVMEKNKKGRQDVAQRRESGTVLVV